MTKPTKNYCDVISENIYQIKANLNSDHLNSVDC